MKLRRGHNILHKINRSEWHRGWNFGCRWLWEYALILFAVDVIGFGEVDLEGIQNIHPHKSKLQAIELQVGTHVYECRYV